MLAQFTRPLSTTNVRPGVSTCSTSSSDSSDISSSSSTTIESSPPVLIHHGDLIFDPSMFISPLEDAIEVSPGFFHLEVTEWLGRRKLMSKKVLDVSNNKGAVWIILEQSLSIQTFNLVKAIPGYDNAIKSKDVVWFLKRIHDVVVLKKHGVPCVDFWTCLSDLVNIKQKQNEDDTVFYDRYSILHEVYQTQCKDKSQKCFEPTIFAAAYLCALGPKHAEFVSTTTNWAKSGLKDFPVSFTDVHQRCTDFHPMSTTRKQDGATRDQS